MNQLRTKELDDYYLENGDRPGILRVRAISQGFGLRERWLCMAIALKGQQT
jgi:hypothetical protein